MNTPRSPKRGRKTSPPLADLPDWFLKREVIPLEDHLALVVCHQTMRAVADECRAAAEAGCPVLLTGETGVGKSLLARFIHANRDPYAPFVSHITMGLPEAVLRARLFGPENATPAKAPLVEEAADGVLVLEEMGDLPPAIQKELLQRWDRGKNGVDQRGPDQWIFATNLPERELPSALLPEFLARLKRIHVPPLRERKQDIPAIVAYFSRLKASREASLKSLEDLAERLSRHSFPGNVRELESIISLEAGGLPWEWRSTGSSATCCVGSAKKPLPRPRRKRGTTN